MEKMNLGNNIEKEKRGSPENSKRSSSVNRRRLEEPDYLHTFKEIAFCWPPGPSEVLISGSFFDDWGMRAKLSHGKDGFSVRLVLPKGHHEFKFYVDGVCCLSKNYRKCKNQFGKEVNYIHID